MREEIIRTRIGEFKRNILYTAKDIIEEVFKIKDEYDFFPYIPWLGKDMLNKIIEEDLIHTKNLIIILDDCNHKPLIFTFTDGHYIIFSYHYKNGGIGVNKEGYTLTSLYEECGITASEILKSFID